MIRTTKTKEEGIQEIMKNRKKTKGKIKKG